MNNWADIITSSDFVWVKNTNKLEGFDNSDYIYQSYQMHKCIFDIGFEEYLQFLCSLNKIIRDASRIGEFGCGNGSLLWYLLHHWDARYVRGWDIQPQLINFCKKTFPADRSKFYVNDGELNVRSDYFDAFLCNSVLQYLTDENHARRVIEEMMMNSNKVIITDVKNKSKHNQFQMAAAHRQDLTLQEYLAKYESTPHLTFHPDWFFQFQRDNNTISIHPMNRKYPDAQYGSFMVVIEK